MEKSGEIVIPILNSEYKVIFCWGNEKYCKKVLTKYNYDVQQAQVDWKGNRGSTHYQNNLHPVITMPQFPTEPIHMATLAHEAVHAVARILLDELDEGQVREVFAHSVGAVMRGVLIKNEEV